MSRFTRRFGEHRRTDSDMGGHGLTADNDDAPVHRAGDVRGALMNEAQSHGWTVISIKNDWRRVFSFD